ncbi:MAG TPA: DUF4956 domain-containing protein [Bacteroidales bacterium]|nr:DUF4956 domain-containing protein [Bacteroidales bacterium]HBZ19717.1 DUF4956 domain-containing protein [Bacteroidales bacterium]
MENLFHSQTIWGILIRFALNLIFLLILIRVLYFRYSKKEKFLFTYFLIGIIVFFICALLKDVGMGLGLGFGLFAIFSILRFRTRNFSVKDMAYIFTTIGISVINSMNMQDVPVIGYLIINSIIVISVFILEEHLKKNMFRKYSIFYDNLDLLKPGNNHKLLKDLSSRTGLKVLWVKIRNMDLKRNVAEVEVYFKE